MTFEGSSSDEEAQEAAPQPAAKAGELLTLTAFQWAARELLLQLYAFPVA